MTKPSIPFKINLTSPVSLLIEWDFEINNSYIIRYLQSFKKILQKKDEEDILFITVAFNALLIKYKDIEIDIIQKKVQIHELLKSFDVEKISDEKRRTFKIPVCYDKFGKDLESISKHSGLEVSEIIKIHSQKTYALYFIGFLPGFLYLGDVDKRIQTPRHKTPRQQVEKGSVGIAENQTGIYPMNSPGGWQIIGRTPIDIFNAKNDPPSLFQAGDQIKFYPISQSEFEEIKNSDKSIEKLQQHD